MSEKLTLEKLKQAKEKMLQPPPPEMVFSCKKCGRMGQVKLAQPTQLIDGYHFYVCGGCP